MLKVTTVIEIFYVKKIYYNNLQELKFFSSHATDRGSVGDKFFEGMTNLSYHKRLKRKLNDCTEYFRTKAEDIAQKLTPERKMFYDNIAK